MQLEITAKVSFKDHISVDDEADLNMTANSTEHNQDKSTIDVPVDNEAEVNKTSQKNSPLAPNVEVTTVPNQPSFLGGIARRFLRMFTTFSEQTGPSEPTAPTDDLGDDTIERIQGRKIRARKIPSFDVKMPEPASYKVVDNKVIRSNPYDLGKEPESSERDARRRKGKSSQAEKKKPKAEQPWREVDDAVDRMSSPIPLEEIANHINIGKERLTNIVTNGELWEVLLRFTPDMDYMTNWVTSKNDYGSQTELIAMTRDIVTKEFYSSYIPFSHLRL